MYKPFLALSLIALPTFAELESMPDYRCIEDVTVAVKHERDRLSTSSGQYDLKYYLIHITNVPDDVLLELGKSIPAYQDYAASHPGTDLSDPDEVRELVNQLSEVWEYGGYLEQERLETSKITPPIYFMFSSLRELDNANYYTRHNRCMYMDGTDVESGLACSIDSESSKFNFDFETQRFERVGLSDWVQGYDFTRTLVTYGHCEQWQRMETPEKSNEKSPRKQQAG